MTTATEPTSHVSTATPVTKIPHQAGQQQEVTSDPMVRMWLEHPNSHAIKLCVTGELDSPRTPQLVELLDRRLTATAGKMIVDLSRVSFLGLDAVRVLVDAQQRAQDREVSLRLIAGSPPVDRALRAAGLEAYFDTQLARDVV